MTGAEWRHDGVAIYYSHASIQLGWILDSEAHGKTWTNRNNDASLSSAVHVRHAWENMLRDSGVQYSWLSYVEVIQSGVPKEYKVLILPACLCLSDTEARQIAAFCQRGGTVIADYLPGLWDQHGKGRAAGGILDEMFGVKHDASLRAADVFGDKLWVEVDQDANYSWKTYDEFLTNKNTAVMDASGFHKAVRALPVNQTHKYGSGTAVLMNLSPQWYNAYRVAGVVQAAKRDIFMQHFKAAGVMPWVRIKGAADREHGYEITYWSKQEAGRPVRTILFVSLNPEISGTDLGGGNSIGLKTATLPITLQFTRDIKGLRDERTGKERGNGREFPFDWKQNEAVVVSFDAP